MRSSPTATSATPERHQGRPAAHLLRRAVRPTTTRSSAAAGRFGGASTTRTPRPTPTTATVACRSAAWFNRLAFAAHYGERNILFNQAIADDSKIMYKRTPARPGADRSRRGSRWTATRTRRSSTAGSSGSSTATRRWRTTRTRSAPRSVRPPPTRSPRTASHLAGQQDVSYIRNSVKATVDAYDGTVNLYADRRQDPVLKAWMRRLPGHGQAGAARSRTSCASTSATRRTCSRCSGRSCRSTTSRRRRTSTPVSPTGHRRRTRRSTT